MNKLHDDVLDQSNSAHRDPYEICIEAENKALVDEIKDFYKKQQLEIRNHLVPLQKEKQRK